MVENPYGRIFEAAERPDPFRPGGLDLTRRALALCGFPAGASVLDLGCGTGAAVSMMRGSFGLDAVGVDPLAPVLAVSAKMAAGCVAVAGTGAAIPFSDGSFAGVFAECSLSAMKASLRVWKEIARVLGPAGLLAVSDLFLRARAGRERAEPYSGSGCPAGALTREEIAGLARDAGFRISIWEDHTDLLRSFVAAEIMKHGSHRAVMEMIGSGSPRTGVGRSRTLLDGEDSGAPGAACPSSKRSFGYFLMICVKEDRWNA